MGLGIGTRLVGGFLAVTAVVGLIGVLAIHGLGEVQARYEAAVEAYAERAVTGLALKAEVLDHVRAQKNYLLRREPRYLEEAKERRLHVARLRAELGRLGLAADEQAALEGVDAALDDLDESFRTGVGLTGEQGAAAADSVLRGKAAAAVAGLDELVARAQEHARSQRELATTQARRTRTLTVTLIAALGVLALALGLALSLSVTIPLSKLQSQITRLASGGSPPTGPAVRGRDEVAQIAEAFYETVQRAEMLREMESRSRRLEALSARVASAQEQERARIARELHDGLGQMLTAIKLGMAAAARELSGHQASAKAHLEGARALIDEGLDEVQRVVLDLRPPALDSLGLPAALNACVRDIARASGIEVTVEAAPFDRRLPAAVETALYRICQEALTNAVRHANAQRVEVTLAEDGRRVHMAVVDDGVGFDPAETTRSDRAVEGVGLLSMERRAAEVEGVFRIDSTPGAGTRVHVWVPADWRRRNGQA
jgi:two-component system sensor histidine kinase UhpB